MSTLLAISAFYILKVLTLGTGVRSSSVNIVTASFVAALGVEHSLGGGPGKMGQVNPAILGEVSLFMASVALVLPGGGSHGVDGADVHGVVTVAAPGGGL